MNLDDPMLQRAIYGLALPGVVGVVLTVAAMLVKRGRFAAFAVPIAAIVGVAVCYWQPFHEAREPGSFGGGWTRWKWLLPTLLALLAAWPGLLMLPRRRWAWVVAAVAIGLVGLLLWPSLYRDTKGQPLAYAALVPIGAAILAAMLYPIARRHDGHWGDLIALGIAGLFTVPLIGLAEFHGAVVLFLPIVAATLAAAVVVLAMRGERCNAARPMVAAGAFVLPIAMLPPAMVSWLVAADLNKLNALALIIPAIAGTMAVVVPRLPRAWAGIAVSGVVGSLGLAVILVVADVSPYLTPPGWLEPWLGEWSYVEPPPEPTFDQDAADFWGTGGS